MRRSRPRPWLSLADVQVELQALQARLTALSYHAHPPALDKRRVGVGGMHQLTHAGREILQANKPIQCLEALAVAAHLLTTTGLALAARLPLSFQTRERDTGCVHRHIVLAVAYHASWGAMGMSRCPDLMDKALVFPSLSALVAEYQRAYSECGHELEGGYVGLPLSGTAACTLPIVWRALHLCVKDNKEEEVWKATLDHFAQSMHALVAHHRRRRPLPSSGQLLACLKEKGGPLQLRDLGMGVMEKQCEEEKKGKKRARGPWLVRSLSSSSASSSSEERRS